MRSSQTSPAIGDFLIVYPTQFTHRKYRTPRNRNKMSFIGDQINFFEDRWLLDPMLSSYVDPDLICPRDLNLSDANQSENIPKQLIDESELNQQSITGAPSYTTIVQSVNAQCNQYNQCYHYPPSSNQVNHSHPNQFNLNDQKQFVVRNQPQQQFNQTRPVGCNSAETNRRASIDCKIRLQNQLQLRKSLSQQRTEQLKAKLNNQPLELPQVIRKASRKLTGRERQLELERQESELRRHQEELKNKIRDLEHKCDKLREILMNIVSNSPQYNEEMINFLEASELLVDSNITKQESSATASTSRD